MGVAGISSPRVALEGLCPVTLLVEAHPAEKEVAALNETTSVFKSGTSSIVLEGTFHASVDPEAKLMQLPKVKIGERLLRIFEHQFAEPCGRLFELLIVPGEFGVVKQEDGQIEHPLYVTFLCRFFIQLAGDITILLNT